MSTEENKEIIRHWVDVWNTGNLEPLQELIAPDYVAHFQDRTMRPESGPEWYRQYIAQARTAFPDFHVTTEDLLTDGDKVVGRWAWSGTHLGDEKTPLGAIAPTGRRIASTTITITRLADGKIAEEWWQEDRLSSLQQLGVIPAPVRETVTPSQSEETSRARTRRTQEVFDHHMRVYLAKDLDAIMADYTEESVLVVNVTPEPLKGLAAIRGLYTQAMEMLTPEVMSQFKVTQQTIDGEIAYLTASAPPAIPFLSDTFVIRGGKIVAQTAIAQFGQGSQ